MLFKDKELHQKVDGLYDLISILKDEIVSYNADNKERLEKFLKDFGKYKDHQESHTIKVKKK